MNDWISGMAEAYLVVLMMILNLAVIVAPLAFAGLWVWWWWLR